MGKNRTMSRLTTTFARSTLVGVALSALLGLAACSSDWGDNIQSGSGTTTSTSTTRRATMSRRTTTTTRPTTTTTRPTTTTTRPTTTTAAAPLPPTPCASGAAVPIGVGDVAQRVVDAHPAGTTYLIKAGTHLRNFSVQPRSGDTFCGEPGAVLDGGRSLKSAFYGGASGVTLDSVTVRDYASGRQGAAIHPETHASGWVVRNVSALHNGWAGLQGADGMRILGGHYNDNDQLGIGGNAATGILLDGLDRDPTTFDGPELARNHCLHEACDWESGGMKWDVGQVTIRNAHVHDNDYRGLWADINARNAVIEHNLVEDNLAEGIFYEISRDAVIRYNRVYGNGLRGAGWYWDGGITVASSSNVEIYGNHLSGNYNGITGTQQDRPDSTPPAHLLAGLHVHDNLICATAGGEHHTGVVADNGANLAGRDISFTGNTIQSAPCR
jgi:Right handed beta helix region